MKKLKHKLDKFLIKYDLAVGVAILLLTVLTTVLAIDYIRELRWKDMVKIEEKTIFLDTCL